MKLDLQNFRSNQDTTLSIENDILTVTSNQNTSTPGIYYNSNIEIEGGNIYTLVIDGSKNSDAIVFPYIRDYNVNTKILDRYRKSNIHYMNNNGLLNNRDDSIYVFSTNDSVEDLKLFVIFYGPEINDTFTIQNMHLYKQDLFNLNLDNTLINES